MMSVTEYAFSFTGIYSNKCDVISAKGNVDDKVTKELLN
jgi:hypothetical protein